jgi:2-polyprenyl-6-methoxyphenol hydroxylase-like FAD-dependent oxidoreductase
VRTTEPILVVGGRTTGLTMACELARHGAPVRLVDASPGIDPHSRATVLHSRTLEVFQDLGIVDDLLSAGVRFGGVSEYLGGQRFLHVRYDGVDSPYPSGLSIGQCVTEAALERLAHRLHVVVERSTTLTALAPEPDRVRATLRHADGREEVVETPWLVGCDGAHSTVRHAVGLLFPGEVDTRQYALADVAVDAALAPDEAHGFLGDRGVVFFFVLPEGRRQIVADVPVHHDPATEAPSLADIQALVDERGPAGVRVSDPRWLAYFRIHYRVAWHYRQGRVLLAGDAVHVHSLLNGHGMNTGIQDAYNLAWKLALVVRGRAPASLLDSYEAERRAVAEDVVAATRATTEELMDFPNLSPAQRAQLLFHVVVPEPARLGAARHLEELDLDYRRSPISEDAMSEAEAARLAGGPHAGAEARDAGPLEIAGRTLTLFELLRGPKHAALLFVGPRGGAGEGLAELAATLTRDWGDVVDVYVVSPADAPVPAALPAGVARVADPAGAAHRSYGAETPCLYLIRPDGYVGCRSAPPAGDALHRYLARVFSPRAGG